MSDEFDALDIDTFDTFEVTTDDMFAFYGTLRNAYLDEEGKFVDAVIPNAVIYNLGAFPALVLNDASERPVKASLWIPRPEVSILFMDLLTDRLDKIEGFDPGRPRESMYVRKKIPVHAQGSDVLAWVYIWNGSVSRAHQLIETGDWYDVKPSRARRWL